MRKLNKRYFRSDAPTDVIAFNLSDVFDEGDLTGEVIISVEQALYNADIFSNTVNNELLLYVVHGLLHLLGFKDATLSALKKKEIRRINSLIT